MKQLIMLCVIAVLTGCASSHVLVGSARQPISIEQVKLYTRAPAKYEEIALLESSSRGALAMSDQSKMNAAIRRLKEEAAKLGANGVILQGSGTQHGAATTVTNINGNIGTGIAMPIIHKQVNGVAIYVVEE